MSVQANQYLIYGAKLDYEKYGKPDDGYDRFEKYCDSAFKTDDLNPNGLHCLFDGMNGHYIVIGRCIKKSGDGETISDTVIEPVNDELAEMIRLLVKAELGIEEPMALHLITHYR